MTSQPANVQVLADGTLRGQSALVTGAGSGIGRAIACRLVDLGAHVVGVGRHEETLAETGELAGGNGTYESHSCDVRDVEAMAELVQKVGNASGLSALINNAGGQFFAEATSISNRGWQAVIDLNLNAVFNATREAFPFLAEAGGSVVNLSLSGVERGGMGMAHSIAARAGVLGLTRTLALEWAENGIRVNCLGPGTVLTQALSGESARQTVDALVDHATPMRAPTLPEEVAELTAFLISAAGSKMTGQLLQVDGGAHLGPGLHMLPGVYS